MVIFHSYVSLPEGNSSLLCFGQVSLEGDETREGQMAFHFFSRLVAQIRSVNCSCLQCKGATHESEQVEVSAHWQPWDVHPACSKPILIYTSYPIMLRMASNHLYVYNIYIYIFKKTTSPDYEPLMLPVCLFSPPGQSRTIVTGGSKIQSTTWCTPSPRSDRCWPWHLCVCMPAPKHAAPAALCKATCININNGTNGTNDYVTLAWFGLPPWGFHLH